MRRRKTITIIVIMLALIAAGVLFLLSRHSGSPDPAESGNGEVAIKETPAETIFFASDYQEEEGWDAPSVNLKRILKAAVSDGRTPGNVIYCGDYTNDRNLYDYQLSPDESIEEIKETVSGELSGVSPGDMIFVQGNHDQLTDSISEPGLHEYDSYLIYVVNTQYGFPWKQGRDSSSEETVKQTAAEMKECFDALIAKGETRPLFIAGHVPLHFTARTSSRHTTGDNMYSAYIFDAVNEAAKDLDIVYVYGHDHSKGWDCYLGGSSVFMEAGDTILIPAAESGGAYTDEFTEETLDFTYMNAGYTGYYMNCGPEEHDNGTSTEYAAADETLTGTVCEIRPDELVIYRYSAEGLHPLGWDGEGDPYKDNIDAGLIDSRYYSVRKESPARVTRKNGQDY